jgi:hypothetical protein
MGAGVLGTVNSSPEWSSMGVRVLGTVNSCVGPEYSSMDVGVLGTVCVKESSVESVGPE